MRLRGAQQTLDLRVMKAQASGRSYGGRRGIVSPTRGLKQRREYQPPQLHNAAGALVA
jgi:hypothetical protein